MLFWFYLTTRVALDTPFDLIGIFVYHIIEEIDFSSFVDFREDVFTMNRKSGLTLVLQPQAYFHELVSATLGQRQVSAQPETEFYLVNLLSQFIKSDRLYLRDTEGNLHEKPLAVLIKEALEETQAEAQRLLFRHVGDVSLYVAGFFQDSLSRKLVDVDYYIDMGGKAYQQVAARAPEETMKSLYGELADKFSNFVDVFAEISEKTSGPKNEKDLLQIYDRWLRTKSERAAKALQDAGILPNPTVKKDWH